MIDINLHKYKSQLRLKKENKNTLIFDPIRKKHLVLQPEELVRQLLICHLIHLGYPKEKIQVEKGLEINGLKRRFDIVVYDSDFSPFLLVECKSHTVKITQDAFDQIANYNLQIRAPFLLLTNGVQTYCCALNFNDKTIEHLDKIPSV